VYAQAALDVTAYSSLAADSTVTQKQGILKTAQTFNTPAPVTSGQSIVYLISASFLEADTNAVVLPYYNAANPSQAYSGPSGTGASQNTTRQDTVALTLTTGVPATTGNQLTPATPNGQIALYTVTVAYGATSVTAANIAKVSAAPFLAAPLLTQIQQAPNGVAGLVRNLSMSVTTAGASASLTADEIIVETALGGQAFKLANFSKTINLATTGPGGMDAGSAPTSGYVALYAIYNPSTGASALLATNATSAAAPSIYGGANMPGGYTASGLVSVWPTNGSGQFVIGIQRDRQFFQAAVQVLNTTTAQGLTSLSIASAVPLNARLYSGYISLLSTSTVLMAINLWTSGGAGAINTHPFDLYCLSNNASVAPFSNAYVNSQNIGYSTISGGGAVTFNIFVTGYTI
jgi:hypothetical protein